MKYQITPAYTIEDGMKCYYDKNGNLIRVTDPKSTTFVTRFEYDEKNRLIHKRTEDSHYVDEQFYKYDENDNIIYMSDSTGESYTYRYENGKLVYKLESLYGVPNWEYYYDENGNITESRDCYYNI